jgi:hypothetical protein
MILKVLWRIDPLLGNDCETNERTAVARQRPERLWTGWKAVFSDGRRRRLHTQQWT